MPCTILPLCQRGVRGTTHRLQCQRVAMHGTGWACCVWAAWGVGMYAHARLCQPPAERCSTLPGGWGRVGTAFSPSVTQEMETSNLFTSLDPLA